MNPLTNVKNIQKLNKTELENGVPIERSWHQQYKESAWIFIGGLSYDLTEGDVICVFSQYGEVANLNLIRDHKTGKSKGFGFLCYEDQRSTILAVDNLNGIKLASRIIRVDHVEEYKVPKMKEDMDPQRQKLLLEGCAPGFMPIVIPKEKEEDIIDITKAVKEEKSETPIMKSKKKKKEKKKSKKRRHSTSSTSRSDDDSDEELKRTKKKKKKKEKKKEKKDR